MADQDETEQNRDEDAQEGEPEEEPQQDPFDDDALFDLVSDASDDQGEAAEHGSMDDEDDGDVETASESEANADETTGAGEAGDIDAEQTRETASSDISDTVPTSHPGPKDFEDLEGETLSGFSETDSEPEVDDAESEAKSTPGDDERPTRDSSGTPADAEVARDRDALLTVENLKTYFYTKEGEVPAVDGVNFEIAKGETLGLVGESGSGKSVSALSILRLVPDPPGKIVDGRIDFEGRDLTEVSEREMQQIRGNDISMIFQEPMTSLNPVYTVGNQIVEAISLHQDVDYAEAREMAIGMLEKVGIPAPRERIDEYPHQMSGGMKQRVMIAMALACNPKLLIADEPTTALDVTIQAQILDLLQELQDELEMSVLFITHDLGVIAETCDYVAVMYGGRVVEHGDVETIFENPSHPYTIGLFSSLPQIDVDQRKRKDRLYVIPGMVPSPQDFPSGCRFRDRCDYATEKCAELPPDQEMREPGHTSLCWYAQEVREGTKEKTGPYPDGERDAAEAAE